jgi:hypothetical protein
MTGRSGKEVRNDSTIPSLTLDSTPLAGSLFGSAAATPLTDVSSKLTTPTFTVFRRYLRKVFISIFILVDDVL